MKRDLFGRPMHVPAAACDQTEYVRKLKRASEFLLRQSDPDLIFLGSALQGWLTHGGNLLRDYLRVAPPAPGSHRTAQIVARMLDGRPDDWPFPDE